MSFLRKRSRSQCSMSDDDSIATRRQWKDDRRYSGLSGMSSNTQVTAADYAAHDSCVIRNFPKHKSTHLRFLAWVAYTRKYTDQSITEDERRTCPLLWCRAVFPDQEEMLKHVWDCEHLSKGLYWCFHCQKPERVGRFQCRRCQGGPSKTDRIATVAKKVFSALGARRGVEQCASASVKDRRLSKISEASEVSESWSSRDRVDEELPPGWEASYIPELPDTFISEMEDTYVPEMSAGWDHLSQELPTSQITSYASDQKKSTECPIQSTLPFNFIGLDAGRESPRPTRLALPRLDTKTIEPSHIPRCSDNPMSATIVSPLSPTGEFEIGTMDTFDVSPTDSELSSKSIFTDSGYSSATFESSWTGSNADLVKCFPEKGTIDKQMFPISSKNLLGSHASFGNPPIMPSISMVSNATNITSFTALTSTHSASRCTVPKKSKVLSPHWSDAESLVGSFADVLEEHLQHSRQALKEMAPNSITRELLTLSLSSIGSIGFEVLAGLLEGRRPAAVMPLFAFTHVAYALAIAVDHDPSRVQTHEWFQDSLSLLDSLSSDRHRVIYTQIMRVIWQPREPSSLMNSLEQFTQSPTAENRLVRACKHFLDVEQSFAYSEKALVSQNSIQQFDFAQASFAYKAKTHIIEELIKRSSIEAFIEDVVAVEKRLDQGHITELRQLELELICAGKLASQSDAAYNRFVDHITTLCDPIYAGTRTEKSRTAHHLEIMKQTQQLFPTEAENEKQNPSPSEDAHFEFDLDLDLDMQLDSGSSTMNAVMGDREIEDLVNMFAHDADNILNQPQDFARSFSPPPQSTSAPPILRTSPPQPSSFAFSTLHSADPSPSRFTTFPPASSSSLSHPSTSRPTQPSTSPRTPPPSNPLPATQKYRCHCGYVPTGADRWKPSNLARHKRIQHADEEEPPSTYGFDGIGGTGVVNGAGGASGYGGITGARGKRGGGVRKYRCGYPGCGSSFTRSDNLRSHRRDKGHEGYGARWQEGLDENGDSGSQGGGDDDQTQRSGGRRSKGPKRRRVLAD